MRNADDVVIIMAVEVNTAAPRRPKLLRLCRRRRMYEDGRLGLVFMFSCFCCLAKNSQDGLF